ncbi:ribbon-helix-helix domain-containing protein [Metabacillus idriensis]|uniref:ribbon-helix-helix domain-containing protein n=1 Tax=Metabacillus idriensis TaxID=324768 RepID=UPI00174AD3EA|nr:ribbon-helix-helix domain-containing protein [Metabacillus idriensis]
MSTKNSLKDKIKKPNATQAFFNSYDTEKTDEKLDNNVNADLNLENINKNKENDNNIDKVNNNTYVKTDNVDVVNTNVTDNSDIDSINEDDDYLRDLVAGKKTTKKKAKKVFTSFYMDPDLAAEVDKIAARGEKGDKSKLINAAIRKLLEEYGVLERKS